MTAAALRTTGEDVRHVAGLVGRVLLGIGALHLPAIDVALAVREWNDAAAMSVGVFLFLWTGRLEFLAVLALFVWSGSVARSELHRARATA